MASERKSWWPAFVIRFTSCMSAMMGAHVCTVPFKVIQQLAQHPADGSRLREVLEDAKAIPKN